MNQAASQKHAMDLRDWERKALNPLMKISASQVETARLCLRKWWFSKVRKLDDGGSTHAQAFGTVLHSVCERFLEADDLGRDAHTGQPVELFPEGWHVAHNRFGGIDGELAPAEQDLVKKLIDKAISEGILERLPGRQVEKQFTIPVTEIDVDGTGHVITASMTGLIDLAYEDGIDDHKTSKSTRYLKTTKTLPKNPQVLIYAKAQLEELRARGRKIPKMFRLRHNQFVKDPDRPVVRKTEVYVEPEYIDAFWESDIVPMAEKMAVVRHTENRWVDIPDPEDKHSACSAYGGCAFRSICNGMENEQDFEKRVARNQDQGYVHKTPTFGPSKPIDNIPTAPTINGVPIDMSGIKSMMAQPVTAAAAPTNPVAPINPPGAPAQPVAAATPVAPEQVAQSLPTDFGFIPNGDRPIPLVLPPWVDPADRPNINDGLGWNDEMHPCPLCAAKAKQKGLPLPDQFDISYPGDGTAQWVGKQGSGLEGLYGRSLLKMEFKDVVAQAHMAVQEAPAAPPPAETQTPPVPAAATPAPATAPQQVVEQVAPSPPAPSAPPAPSRQTTDGLTVPTEAVIKDAGRPPRAFTMLVNCAPVVWPSTTRKESENHLVYFDDQYKLVIDEMARMNGVASFYDLDTWKRRDALAGYAPVLADRLGKNTLIVGNLGEHGSDRRALVDALMAEAESVIQATR